jgi:DUF1365 family protein
VATLDGTRRRASIANLLRLQLVAPLAPLLGAMWIRLQGVTLWTQRAPAVREAPILEREKVGQL